MKQKLRDEHQHKKRVAVYVCLGCLVHRTTKLAAAPARLPGKLKAEYCPRCGRDNEFIREG